MKSVLNLARVMWVVLVATAVAGAAFGTELEDDIRRIVEEERARGGTPAMSVAVVQNGRVVVQLASGLADQEEEEAATLATQFPAASVSKLLTAVLVMQQVEKGRLDLDTSVNNYLEPPFWVRDAAGEPAPVTLRQLLSHNSGLPVTWGGIIAWGNPVPTLEEYLRQGQRTIHPPGERLVYANNAFALAGYLAAKVAGESFPEHARRALLEPLGMSHSTFESPWQLEGSLAAAYGDVFGGGSDRTRHVDTTAIGPAGALITTAPDLARFALMLLAGGELDGVRILRPESVAEMMRLQVRAHPELDVGFGLGFGVIERPGRRVVWWDGSLSGAAARLALLPDARVGVVVLSNLANNDPSSVTARRILEVLVPPETAPSYRPTEEELDRLVGLYRTVNFIDPEKWYFEFLMAFSVTRDGNTLVLSSPVTGETTLLPVGPKRFRIRGSMFDDSTVLWDGDSMYVGFVETRRISRWQSPTALLVYAAVVGLLLVGVLGWGTWRTVRRLRHR